MKQRTSVCLSSIQSLPSTLRGAFRLKKARGLYYALYVQEDIRCRSLRVISPSPTGPLGNKSHLSSHHNHLVLVSRYSWSWVLTPFATRLRGASSPRWCPSFHLKGAQCQFGGPGVPRQQTSKRVEPPDWDTRGISYSSKPGNTRDSEGTDE